MVGPELLPAAIAAAARLAETAQKDDLSDVNAIREAAKGSAELAEAGRIRARRLALREQALLTLWKPLAKFFGVSQEYFEFHFPADLAQKLEHVPDNDLQAPRPAIVAPAMEALGYSLDEPPLKEMYLNLLAGASMKSRASLIHPSFVDTVRQIAAEEAPVLDFVLKSVQQAAARITRVRVSDGGYVVLQPCILPLYAGAVQTKFPKLGSWVINWQRLGLIELTFTEQLLNPDADPYTWVEHRSEYIEALASEPLPNDGTDAIWRVAFDRGIIRTTPRGLDFYKAVNEP